MDENQEVIDAYLETEPTAENNSEILKELGSRFDMSPNKVRLILTEAEVFVKAEPKTNTKSASSGGGTKVSKEQALNDLREAITAAGAEVDETIVSKLTGKAAVYLTSVIKKG